MSKRKIKPKRIPGFTYQSPIVRRNENDRKIEQHLSQSENHPPTSNPVLNPIQRRSVSPALQPSPENLPQNHVPPESYPPNTVPIPNSIPSNSPSTPPIDGTNVSDKNVPDNLDSLLTKIYKYKSSPAAYSAAVQNYIDRNYSLSLHKQRRKKFKYGHSFLAIFL